MSTAGFIAKSKTTDVSGSESRTVEQQMEYEKQALTQVRQQVNDARSLLSTQQASTQKSLAVQDFKVLNKCNNQTLSTQLQADETSYFGAELSVMFESKLNQALDITETVRKSASLRLHEESSYNNDVAFAESDSQWSAAADKLKIQTEDLCLKEAGVSTLLAASQADLQVALLQVAPNGIPQCGVDRNGLLVVFGQTCAKARASLQTRIKEYNGRLLTIQASVSQMLSIRTNMCHHKDAHKMTVTQKQARFGGSLDDATFGATMKNINDAFNFHQSCTCPSRC